MYRVKWDEVLSKFGCVITAGKDELQPCPLHPHSQPSLRIIDGYMSTNFTCQNSNCPFETGDAVALLAAMTRDPAGAAAAFARGGGYYETRLDTPESRSGEYSNGPGSQEFMRAYLARGHKALSDVNGCMVRLRWTELGCNAPTGRLPEQFGVLTAENMPAEFKHLQVSKYAYAAHTYIFDDVITAVSVRSAAAPEKRDLIRLHPTAIGVYPAPNLAPARKRIFLVQNEMAATALRTLGDAQNADIPVFAAIGLPLPPSFWNVKTIDLVTYEGNELQLDTALLYLGSSNIIEAAPEPPVFRVIPLPKPPDLGGVLGLAQTTTPPGTTGLATWIARKLHAVYLEHGADAALQALQHGPELLKVKDTLLSALSAEGAPAGLYAAVQAHCATPKAKLRLANGNIVYRTASGYRGILADQAAAAPIQLSNATFDVVEELLDVGGTLWYKCALHTADQGDVQVSLQHSDFESANRLQKAVATALAEQHISSHATFYGESGFNWGEIRDTFKDVVRTVREVQAYGADDALDVHLPGLIIVDGGRRIEQQRRVLGIPADISRHYAGIDYRTRSDTRLAPVVELWRDQSLEAAALALGISQIMYCVAQDVVCRKCGVPAPIQHMVYVDPLVSTWRPTCEQLSALFAGSPLVGRVPSVRGTTHAPLFRQLKHLGSLPWIAELPDTSTKLLQGFVRDVPVNLIGLGNDSQGAILADIGGVTFVALDRAPEAQPRHLAPERLGRLRGAMPELLQAVIVATADKTADEWTSMQLPAQSMFHGIAGMFAQLEAMPQLAPVDMLVRERYIPYSKTVIEAFYRGLRALFQQNVNGLAPRKHYGPPAKDASGALVYIMPDIVLIDHAVLPLIAKVIGEAEPIGLSAITKELMVQEQLTDLAPGRYPVPAERFWAIKRELWDSRVVGLELTPPAPAPQFKIKSGVA